MDDVTEADEPTWLISPQVTEYDYLSLSYCTCDGFGINLLQFCKS